MNLTAVEMRAFCFGYRLKRSVLNFYLEPDLAIYLDQKSMTLDDFSSPLQKCLILKCLEGEF